MKKLLLIPFILLSLSSYCQYEKNINIDSRCKKHQDSASYYRKLCEKTHFENPKYVIKMTYFINQYSGRMHEIEDSVKRKRH